MTILYNCRHDGDQYRVTKFDEHLNVLSSYLCTLEACDCPAGVRPMCRHREMLPRFIQRKHIGDGWAFDYDRGGWVQMEDSTEINAPEPEPMSTNEEDCPGHVASEHNSKICGICGIHIDSLRPPDRPVVYVNHTIRTQADLDVYREQVASGEIKYIPAPTFPEAVIVPAKKSWRRF